MSRKRRPKSQDSYPPVQKKRVKTDAFRSVQPEDIQKRRLLSIVLIAFIVLLFAAVYYFVGQPLVARYLDSPEAFRDHVRSTGAMAPLLMMGIMALQIIVALIPGEPFELAAGFIFGWLPGAVWCLLGSAIASALVFIAVRKWGVKLVELFFSREKIMSFSFLQNKKKLDLLLFILFLIPGTPKDLLTYLVGLTPVKLSTFLLITTVARIPSVVSSTVTGSLAQKENYLAAFVTYAMTLVISLICVLIYRRISLREQTRENEPEKKQEPHA